MPSTSHEPHISMHVRQIGRAHGADRTQALLDRAGLRVEAGRVSSQAGQPLGPTECLRYLAAVKEVFGEATHAFARINFGFARCSCVASDEDSQRT